MNVEFIDRLRNRGVVSKPAYKIALLIGLLLLGPALVQLGKQSWVLILLQLYIFAIAALSFDLLFGYTGILSFGHALFFGGGAYMIGVIYRNFGLTYLEAVPIALIVITLIALGIGAISLKTSGVYFALVTLAFAQLGYELSLSFRDITGGDNGISGIEMTQMFGFQINNYYISYYICLLALIGVYFSLKRIVNSPFGRILQGIRENEERIQMLGINTYRYKLAAFVFSGFMAAVAGVLYPLFVNFIHPNILYWSTTGDILLITLIGGFGTLWGPAIGTAFFLILEEGLANLFTRWRIVFGLVFIFIVIYAPTGIAGLIRSDDGERRSPLHEIIDEFKNGDNE